MSFKQLFATRSLDSLLADMESDNRLKRALGPVNLTALGVGAVIGAGIFVATGAAAHNKAGPALMVSYMVAGLTCIFAALCYAEFASMAPVAGSAYTYAYTTLGELFAWIIGWDLVLEYAVGAATVANGWSGYFQSVLLQWESSCRLHFPEHRTSTITATCCPMSMPSTTGKPVTQQGRQADGQGRRRGRSKRPSLRTACIGSTTRMASRCGQVGDKAFEGKLQNVQRAVINLPAVWSRCWSPPSWSTASRKAPDSTP